MLFRGEETTNKEENLDVSSSEGDLDKPIPLRKLVNSCQNEVKTPLAQYASYDTVGMQQKVF